MSYRWQPGSGTYDLRALEHDGLLGTFDSQAAAEEWLTLNYDDLHLQGVMDVSLLEEDRLVYGPMPLTP